VTYDRVHMQGTGNMYRGRLVREPARARHHPDCRQRFHTRYTSTERVVHVVTVYSSPNELTNEHCTTTRPEHIILLLCNEHLVNIIYYNMNILGTKKPNNIILYYMVYGFGLKLPVTIVSYAR